jgi:HTH-type transcriptional regulator / antitoxin MqsA
MTPFEGKTLTVEYMRARVDVEGLSGWRCNTWDEVIFDSQSARRYADAGDKIVQREREQPTT